MGAILSLRGDKTQAIALLQKALTLNNSSPKAHTRLGVLLWESGQAAAVPHLLQAAKLDPNAPTPFVYLGHHYVAAGHKERGLKCYQKALSLDPANPEAGERLCGLLALAGEDAAVTAVLEAACNEGEPARCGWAWLRRGAGQIRIGQHADAVVSLQNALKTNAQVGFRTYRSSFAFNCFNNPHLIAFLSRSFLRTV